MRGLLLAITGLITTGLAINPPGNDLIHCKSEPTEGFLAESQVLRGPRKRSHIDGSYVRANQSRLLLDTYFHVVTTTPNEITNNQLNRQIEVLNDNFDPYDIQFKLRGIDWTINATWANNTYDYWMKKKLHKGDYKTLNVYFISHLVGGGLGVSSANLLISQSLILC